MIPAGCGNPLSGNRSFPGRSYCNLFHFYREQGITGGGIDRPVAPSHFTVYTQPSVASFHTRPLRPAAPQRTSGKTFRGTKVQPEARRFALTSDPHNVALCRMGILSEFPWSIARPPGFASSPSFTRRKLSLGGALWAVPCKAGRGCTRYGWASPKPSHPGVPSNHQWRC